jgi:hypothetical protein
MSAFDSATGKVKEWMVLVLALPSMASLVATGELIYIADASIVLFSIVSAVLSAKTSTYYENKCTDYESIVATNRKLTEQIVTLEASVEQLVRQLVDSAADELTTHEYPTKTTKEHNHG